VCSRRRCLPPSGRHLPSTADISLARRSINSQCRGPPDCRCTDWPAPPHDHLPTCAQSRASAHATVCRRAGNARDAAGRGILTSGPTDSTRGGNTILTRDNPTTTIRPRYRQQTHLLLHRSASLKLDWSSRVAAPGRRHILCDERTSGDFDRLRNLTGQR
jgi:hypothetical protein